MPANGNRRIGLTVALLAALGFSTSGPAVKPLLEAGWSVGENTVADSMRRQGLFGRKPKRRRGLTKQDRAAAKFPDLLKRDFSSPAPNRKWCGDMTEIPTDEGKLYLATVLDLGSRRLPGFAIGEHHDSPLAKAALCMAAAVRGGDIAGVIFHTDKGGEYVGDKLPITPSRLQPLQLAGRLGLGAVCGAIACRAADRSPILGGMLGALGALGGSVAGYRYRTDLARRLGAPDLPLAIAEDATAIAVALAATKG